MISELTRRSKLIQEIDSLRYQVRDLQKDCVDSISRYEGDLFGKRERTQIFEHVVKNVNDSIVITDMQRRIIIVNRSFCDTYGYDAEKVIGQEVSFIWSEKNRENNVEEVFAPCNLSGWKGELLSRKQDGSEFPVYVTTSVIKDETGYPKAIAGIICDMSKQKQLKNQLLQSEKNKSLDVLVGGITYNFNTILNVVMGYASMLEETGLEHERLERYVSGITDAAERGTHLIHQLMTYIEKLPVHYQDVSVHDVIDETTGKMMQVFPDNITFSVGLEPHNLIIRADRNQICQVLFNLFLNAREAMPHGGEIRIRTEIIHGDEIRDRFVGVKDREYVRVVVEDTGTGIDEEIQSRIFDPFFTTKEEGTGVGLGLPLVGSIVESHNGFIDVTSARKCGATFSVYFPLERFEEKTKSFVEEATEKDTILVVEDEMSMRLLLSEKLEEAGYNVVQAADGIEALEIFDREGNGLGAVLLDIGLPRFSGYETFIKMRERNAGIPVIITSGYSDPDVKRAIEIAGARLFVQKPYKFDHILKVLREVIKPKNNQPDLEPIYALQKITDNAKQKPLGNDLPEIDLKSDDEISSTVKSIYDFMKQRQERLQRVLHFSSLTSHELRTPLTIIRNQLEYGLQSDVSIDNLKDIVASTYDEIIRLHHLVNDLLTISTLQAGTLKLEKKDVDFHTFIKDIYDEVLLLSREKDISVVLARGPQVKVHCDPRRIRQVLFNLIENALKYTPEKGRIRISYQSYDNVVEFKISDTGPGIPSELVGRIFEPFYQVSSDDREIHQGAGLGLALVRWIVEAHDGTVNVDSEEGKGTTFTITLPKR